MTTQHVIIAGGRDFTDTALMRSTLISLVEEGWLDSEPVILCGMAKGADLTAFNLCKHEFNLNVLEYPADWKDLSEPCLIKHNRYGAYNALAGMKRNIQMAMDADSLVAFWDGKSHGTKDMIDTMVKLGKHVKVINY
ncbi:chromosome segregation protein [Vibrio phage JSF3]|uniref:YspA cpYpsA-related SLOG domain-containing protein n=2 Tax=Pacinivirus VCO139 TaxID=2846607 RepID=R9R4K2_9CAUD|nr:hypothetical protein M612_gp01 [Vibrio phage JA-1]YP_009874304.1 hypothetical protein HYO77_gp01 [Vibrio phage VCO139]YP_009876335.1 chromosome segregation protein [Vibrio phage JSF3]AGI61755.1 hypothetical protein JA1_0001 [Vibrio phage JA-1]AGI61832.1 hypothetical protein VCO139_0001 [Vibrio phage VCO139]APD18122.1 chromosome segregation protein [Vibrio phage JSF3]